MNLAIWILAGAAAGWIGHSLLRFNPRRSLRASVIIGAVAACLGGALLAPMITAAAIVPGDFNPHSLLTAIASAAAGLIVSDLLHSRLGI